MKLNLDLIVFEADTFAATLDITAVHIYDEVYKNLKHTLRMQIEGANEWDEEDTGISVNQYKDFIFEQHSTQMRALSAAIFILLDLQLLGFMRDVKERFLSRNRFPGTRERYGRSGDGELLRLAAEYHERCDINCTDLPAFEACREIVLARNSCVHNHGRPSSNYLAQTSQTFLHDDGYLSLTDVTFEEAVRNVRYFTAALARAVSSRVRPRTSSGER